MPTFRQDTKIGGMVPMMKTDDINDQAITKDKIRDGNVTAEKLADGAVSTDKLPDGAIKTPKIADGNITTSKLAEASVVTSKIADQNVTKEKIADQSVDNSKLSPSAVTYDKLKDKSVITEKLNDRAVTTDKVEEKAITNAKIGDSAVDGRVISEASVEKKHLANDSVSTEKLQDSAITSDKIHIHAVTEEKIEDSAISNSKLADNSVGTSKIKDGNVTNEKVANNTITIDKFDPELRKSIQAATGLPENLVEVIQDVDVEVKSLHSKDEDLQSQIADKQQQITANDKDIESLQNRSTQMEQSINNIAVTGGASVANTVTYSNTASGLVSINAQGAIDELAAKNATKAEKSEVTAELDKKFEKESVVQESGDAEDKVMSQKATTTAIEDETTRAKAAEEAIVFDVSVYNNGSVFESLKAILSSSNLNTLIPTSARRGGMAIRFIQGSEQSSDNKYVQFRCMAQNFTTDVTQWQGVDDEPTAGSDNLVKSGGVAEKYGDNKSIYPKTDNFIYIILDEESKIPFAIRKNGKVYIPDIENKDIETFKKITTYLGEGNKYGWIEVTTDSQQRLLEGINSKGEKVINIPTEICGMLIKGTHNENWIELVLDNQGHLIEGTRKNGNKYIAKLETGDAVTIPACPTFDIWEPEKTTDAYKTPNDRSQVTCSLSYQELLDTYYNIYLHKDTSKYHVIRKELGYDSSGTHMIYEYDFIPQNYNRVVMISAGMNSCELSGIFGLAYFIKNIIEDEGDADASGGLKYIFNNVRLKVIPVICPAAFDMNPLNYLSFNGVNINRNFNFDGNWDGLLSEQGTWSYKGVSPESEVETMILKRWMQDNAHMAELWIDCHTDVGNNTQLLFYTSVSNTELRTIISNEQVRIKDYYISKGYSPTYTSCNIVDANSQYGKTRMSYYNYNLPAMMIEQYEGYTGIGGTGMNCEEVDINNYVLMLRAYILAVLRTKRKKIYLNLPNISLQNYIENLNKIV